VHVIDYRASQDGIIEIVRILHERMEPGRHLKSGSEQQDD
jgi:plasmid stabilization system protein ParE